MTRRSIRASLLALALACAPNSAPLPTDAPFLHGTVTAVGRIAEGWTVRVEERPSDAAGSAKGVFRVDDGTSVRRASGDRVPGTALREGQRVRVWVTGPVMESYPVQARASVIVIDDDVAR